MKNSIFALYPIRSASLNAVLIFQKIRTFLTGSTFILTAVAAQTAEIGYTFETPGNISGTTSNIVYTAPDTNTFGAGISVGNLVLSDADTPSDHFGRIEDIGGGSTEAALTARADPSTISFTITIDDTVTVDLTQVSFDNAFRFTKTGNSTVDWSFSTSVGGTSGNETSGDFTHDGGDDYQSSASGDITLTGLTGLTNTTVTFTWVLDSTRSNTFAIAALGLDDIEIIGTAMVIDDGSPTIQSFEVDDKNVPSGTPVLLSWDVSDADTITVSGVGSVGAADSATVSPSVATTYTLVATNEIGSTQAEVEVKIGPDSPNILLILVDDWGVTDLSVPFAYTSYDDNGTPLITNLNILHKTPNLEALASTGMKFTQAYATPKCSPSRATLMTGYHPARHGITFHLAHVLAIGNGPNNWRYRGFDATDVTLAHMLAPAGYRSIHCGKWHLGGRNGYAQYPTAVGFDVNIAGSNSGQPARYIADDTDGFSRNDRPMPNMDHYIGTDMYLTKALTIEMNGAITDAVEAEIPFFGNMSYYGVHRPYTRNPDAIGDYSNADSTNHEIFATMVEAIDVSLGDITSQLEDLGIAEETLIIHLGDNGSESPVHGDQASIPLGIFSDFPMRGQKNDGYQGGSRVPLMISWAKPASNHPMQQSLPITGGSVEHDIVGIEDIAPTILSVVDVEQPFMDGYDLSPYLVGEAGSHRPQKYLLHYPNGSFPNGQLNWYREGDWKLMYGYEEDLFLLFNLADDPTESNNLASSEPERVVQMARAMANELDSKWGDLGELWPVILGTYPPRPGTNDTFLLSYNEDGRDTVDSDGDGLVDMLEDLDGDGLVSSGETSADDSDTDKDNTNDYAELRLNLNPLDPNLYFATHVSSLDLSNISLSWPSSPGLFFNILTSDDLSTPTSDWTILIPGVEADGSLYETIQEIPIDATRKFFSIELLPE
ncbi:MAG: sulfatase-like hydrolase/transferase [Akkermansiaceae bacterium]